MEPITELDVAKGIQASLGELDLNHPHARETCLGLMSSLERSLDRIRRAEWAAEEAAIDAEWEAAEKAKRLDFAPSSYDNYLVALVPVICRTIQARKDAAS